MERCRPHGVTSSFSSSSSSGSVISSRPPKDTAAPERQEPSCSSSLYLTHLQLLMLLLLLLLARGLVVFRRCLIHVCPRSECAHCLRLLLELLLLQMLLKLEQHLHYAVASGGNKDTLTQPLCATRGSGGSYAGSGAIRQARGGHG